MTLEEFEWVAVPSVVSTLVPLTCFFIYRKIQPRQYRILVIALLMSFTFDVIDWILSSVYNKSPAFSNNLYYIISLPVIMAFYHETLTKRTLKILVRLLTVVFLVVALIFAIKQGLAVNNFNTWTLSSIVVSVTSLFFVGDLNLMDESSFRKNVSHEANILLNTSLAVYYFATVVLFILTEYILANYKLADVLFIWTLHNTVHVLKNIGIDIAFRKSRAYNKSLLFSNDQAN